MKFGVYIAVDDWCMMVCRMTRSKVKVTGPLKFRKLHFSRSISSRGVDRQSPIGLIFIITLSEFVFCHFTH